MSSSWRIHKTAIRSISDAEYDDFNGPLFEPEASWASEDGGCLTVTDVDIADAEEVRQRMKTEDHTDITSLDDLRNEL